MAAEIFPISDLSPQFINASWVDIVEAEESEDFEAIERLRYFTVGWRICVVSSSVRCTSSASSLSDKENPATPFTPCSSIHRVPLSTMENYGAGVPITPFSSFTAIQRGL